MSPRPTRILTPIVAVLAVSGLLSACAEAAPLPTPSPTPIETIEPTGDGVLRIGTLFPMSGDIADIGPGLVAAVEIAVRDINIAGGVLDQPVEVLHRNSGQASEDMLETAFADLVSRGVDVVIGPATSALAERLVPLAAEAGVAVISPAATYSSVQAADSEGVFFRTIPTHDFQAVAIAETLAEDDAETVALVMSADATGLAFELALRAALGDRGIRLAAVEQLDAATTPSRLAFTIAGASPDAVILATGASLADQNARVLDALLARQVSPTSLWLTAQNIVDYSAALDAGALDGANGVREGAEVDEAFFERLRLSDPALLSARFAPEAYDAVVLAALAAQFVGDDGGRSIASAMVAVSSQGVPCTSFGECLSALETEPAVNYEGLSGPLTMNAAGDVIDGEFALYRYTAENRPERVGSLPLVQP